MLNLFEDEKDINSKKINIKAAINYVAEAWSCVIEQTVLNCWRKTGILPSLSDEDIDDALQIQEEEMDNEKADIDQIIKEFDMNNSSTFSLANALTNFFQNFEGILIKDILDENNIIRLI